MTETTAKDGEVDPATTGAALAKVGGAVATEATSLISKVLGPSAEELGEALRRLTAQRTRNVGRIVSKADDKSSGKGQVPPRVAHRILDEGSYCDDELMAEYLSGVLAGSRTPDGRDDRGVVWSDIVTSLSTLQLRAHFILYREWAARLGRADYPTLNLGIEEGRIAARMQVDLFEFERVLVADSDVDPQAAVSHSIVGLARIGLIGQTYRSATTKDLPKEIETQFPAILVVDASAAGMELYGWALGHPGMTADEFLSSAKSFAEAELPRLQGVEIPALNISA